MVNFSFGIILLLSQLVGLGAGLPQIVEPHYSEEAIVAGSSGEIVVSLEVLDGYKINRIPQMQLKLTEVDGLALSETHMISPSEDPKATSDYYVDVPNFDVEVEAAAAGVYEIPGELVYFFCSLADGFCSRQTVDVKVPVIVE